MTIMTEHSNKSAELVNELRKRFLEEYENNKELYDDGDVKKIRESDWYVKRFLLARGRRVDDAFVMIRDAMRWRKEIGLPLMKDNDFPLEFHKIGGLFSYNRDRKGNVVIYMRIRMHRKIPELEDPTKMFLMHVVNKVDIETDGNGFAVVFDLTGAGYANVDMEFLKFLLTAGNSYFPVGLKYILVYEMPWVLTPFRKIAMAMVPTRLAQLIKFANKNDVTDFIAPENLPDYMGGTCRRNYRAIPRDCPSVFKLAAAYGYTDEDIKRHLPIFEPLLQEADNAIKNGNYIDPPDFERDYDNDENDKENDESKDFKSLQSLNLMNKIQGHNNKLLGLFPNDMIQFVYDSHLNVYFAQIILQNPSQSPIAFKVQSNNPESYYVSPRLGIILQNATLKISIQLRNGYEHKVRDKFLIIVIPIAQQKLNADEFSKLWQNCKSQIVSYKLCSNVRKYTNNTDSIIDENSDDVNSQIASLIQLCGKLERNQQKLSSTINILILMILIIALFFILILSFGDNYSVKSVINEIHNKSSFRNAAQ